MRGWVIGFLGVVLAATASAAPTTTTYSGRVVDAGGAPVNATANLRISLHTAGSGGAEVWFEQHTVPIEHGYFNVVLGATTPLRPVLKANSALWVEVAVDGVPTGGRTPLNAAPYSILDSLGGLSCNTGDGVKYNATTQAWECNPPAAAPTQYGLLSMQAFTTAGSHTWTRPPGVRRIEVIVTGGGGGGGSHNSDDAQGGGGAGGTAIEIIDVTSVASVSVTVGTGGTGACGDSSNGGTSGGASSFGTFLSATGGAPPATWAIGGLGGIGQNGQLNLRGNDGGTGNIDGGGNEEAGGTGGASYWGGGGTGASVWSGGVRAGVNGSGGGGAHAATVNCGGNGGAGIVVVREYGG